MRVRKWLLSIIGLAGALAALTACGGGGFELSTPVEQAQLVQGESTEMQLKLDRHGGFTAAVDLNVENLPDGVSATLDPRSTEGTESSLLLEIAQDAPPGSYTLTIRGQSGRLDKEMGLALRIDPRPDFQVSLEPAELDLEQGETAAVSVDTVRQGGFAEEVSLRLDETSERLVVEMVTENDTATLYVETPRDLPEGAYSATVVGRSDQRERSAQLVVRVTEVAGFDLRVDPGGAQLAREETSELTISVDRWAGFDAPVHLAVAAGLPAGMDATFEPNPVEEDTSTLRLTAHSNAPLRSFTITIRGSADDTADEIPLDIVVIGQRPEETEDND